MEMKDLREEKRDFNQNLIEPIEQLCSMISQLEKDGNIDVAERNRMNSPAVDLKYDVNPEPVFKYSEQIEPERDVTKDKCGSITIYEDIMSLLGTLDNEDTINSVTDSGTAVVLSRQNSSRRNTQTFSNFGRQQDDLETARLQIEEKNATIECLKDQLKSERKAACDKMATQKRCHTTKIRDLENKYRMIVKRHQKFIEQLIAEKTDLTQTCDSLVKQMKEMEQKIQRDLKVITERHAVELQRAKENMAASEKIRRERWLEMKTSKIKEMTVKGLEPELHNMMEQHQREIQELRFAHVKELQDAELRAMCRSNQQLEQLRIELTDTHEKILAKEKDILTARHKEKLEEQEAHFQTQQKIIAEHFEKEKSMLIAEQKKREEETSAMTRQTQENFQRETEKLKKQHETARTNFEESLRKEWLAWADRYKKEQSENFARTETIIRDECEKKRDRQIEIAIARLEKEYREMRAKLQQSFDNKLELIKEDYNAKFQSAVKSENIHKNKLLLLEEQLRDTEIHLEKTESKLKECMSNACNMNDMIAKLTAEKDNARDIARREFGMEKRALEEKIASLQQEIIRSNASRDQFMTQLQSRIKLVVTRKILTIQKLNKKLEDADSRCEHLEKLLDQQRKEYILKGLCE